MLTYMYNCILVNMPLLDEVKLIIQLRGPFLWLVLVTNVCLSKAITGTLNYCETFEKLSSIQPYNKFLSRNIIIAAVETKRLPRPKRSATTISIEEYRERSALQKQIKEWLKNPNEGIEVRQKLLSLILFYLFFIFG